MSNFDPDAFMTQTVDQPLSIERTLIPVGEYKGRIDDFTSEAFETIEFEYKKGDRAGEKGEMIKFNCPIIIDDDAVRALFERDKVVTYFACILDFDDKSQLTFGPNRNIDLGRLRHAVDQNGPGAWNPSMLKGAGPFMVKIEHKSGKRKDGSTYKNAEPVRFAPLRP